MRSGPSSGMIIDRQEKRFGTIDRLGLPELDSNEAHADIPNQKSVIGRYDQMYLERLVCGPGLSTALKARLQLEAMHYVLSLDTRVGKSER